MAAEYRALAERAERASFPEPPAETWDGYWEHVRSKMGRRFGWLFAAIGAAVLIVAGIWSYYSHPHNPLAEWGVGLSLAGLAILFLTVLRERLKELKHDRYRNVRR
ncbi:MAG: hypothetical protein BWZ10_02889 [candidate division BRC1 bacterium ADurb.BinA364]|nr:MAG: hypothetical protein BWZ10_02889 [candidate division BRC1 bacterium ADurb.BinA364]